LPPPGAAGAKTKTREGKNPPHPTRRRPVHEPRTPPLARFGFLRPAPGRRLSTAGFFGFLNRKSEIDFLFRNLFPISETDFGNRFLILKSGRCRCHPPKFLVLWCRKRLKLLCIFCGPNIAFFSSEIPGKACMKTLSLMLLVISIPVTILAITWACHLHIKNRARKRENGPRRA
jgi:hypothetical protein